MRSAEADIRVFARIGRGTYAVLARQAEIASFHQALTASTPASIFGDALN